MTDPKVLDRMLIYLENKISKITMDVQMNNGILMNAREAARLQTELDVLIELRDMTRKMIPKAPLRMRIDRDRLAYICPDCDSLFHVWDPAEPIGTHEFPEKCPTCNKYIDYELDKVDE